MLFIYLRLAVCSVLNIGRRSLSKSEPQAKKYLIVARKQPKLGECKFRGEEKDLKFKLIEESHYQRTSTISKDVKHMWISEELSQSNLNLYR